MTRRVFYSFHYESDSLRAAQVRKIGAIEGNSPVTDNDWEEVKKGGESAIKRWISAQMDRRSCTVVLVGENTAGRKWINYEICKSWSEGMGVVGIHIHGLKDPRKGTSKRGRNPFQLIDFGHSGRKLSSVVKCYNPRGSDSQERYDLIKKNLARVVEEAITIREKFSHI